MQGYIPFRAAFLPLVFYFHQEAPVRRILPVPSSTTFLALSCLALFTSPHLTSSTSSLVQKQQIPSQNATSVSIPVPVNCSASCGSPVPSTPTTNHRIHPSRGYGRMSVPSLPRFMDCSLVLCSPLSMPHETPSVQSLHLESTSRRAVGAHETAAPNGYGTGEPVRTAPLHSVCYQATADVQPTRSPSEPLSESSETLSH